MKVAVMQPYFMPYIGYFQLMSSVDIFVLYDNIKYTKKGWINRNRMLLNGKDSVFSLPLKKDSDSLDIVQRELAADFIPDKLLNKFKGAYKNAPFFDIIFPFLEMVVRYEKVGLFDYLYHAISETAKYLGIETEIRISSELDIDHGVKGQEKVLALCGALDAHTYINAIGGMSLYERESFKANDIELKFVNCKPFEYIQFDSPFVAWLSIIDVMMFNSPGQIDKIIRHGYELL